MSDIGFQLRKLCCEFPHLQLRESIVAQLHVLVPAECTESAESKADAEENADGDVCRTLVLSRNVEQLLVHDKNVILHF